MRKSVARSQAHNGFERDQIVPNPLSPLMSAWKETESAMERIFEREAAGTVSLNSDPALRANFDILLQFLEAKQLSLIEQIVDTPAISLEDVLGKLVLWKSMSFAGYSGDMGLAPAERLISGAIGDLEAFLAVTSSAKVTQT